MLHKPDLFLAYNSDVMSLFQEQFQNHSNLNSILSNFTNWKCVMLGRWFRLSTRFHMGGRMLFKQIMTQYCEAGSQCVEFVVTLSQLNDLIECDTPVQLTKRLSNVLHWCCTESRFMPFDFRRSSFLCRTCPDWTYRGDSLQPIWDHATVTCRSYYSELSLT